MSEKGEVAFAHLANFTARLREQYPEDKFPDEIVINHLNPSNEQNTRKNVISYEAVSGESIVGIVFGQKIEDILKGDWYIIDPEYQNTEVKNKLIEAVSRDFRRVTLLANAQDNPKVSADDPDYFDTFRKKKGSRQQALIRYYERLGFKPDTSSELYKYYKESSDPMPMVRENEDRERSV